MKELFKRIAHRIRYLRIWGYQSLLRPVSAAARKRRMGKFVKIMGITPMTRVLDLGGHPDIWSYVDVPLDITILNLPDGIERKQVGKHNFKFVEGDACDVKGFEEGDFDLVYSNSVIEHVGAENRQQAFAEQARRFSVKYWVQTPSKWFPIEPHCGMPFWWFYPEFLRQKIIERWRPKLPAWTEMVEQTRVLEKESLERMFPEAIIYTERVLGIPKSYVAWTPDRAGSKAATDDGL